MGCSPTTPLAMFQSPLISSLVTILHSSVLCPQSKFRLYPCSGFYSGYLVTEAGSSPFLLVVTRMRWGFCFNEGKIHGWYSTTSSIALSGLSSAWTASAIRSEGGDSVFPGKSLVAFSVTVCECQDDAIEWSVFMMSSRVPYGGPGLRNAS